MPFSYFLATPNMAHAKSIFKTIFFQLLNDELLWGAAWLHKATKNPTYLSDIQVNGQTVGADESDNIFWWNNMHVSAIILLSKAFLIQNVQSLHDYKGHADSYICSLIPGQSQYTPDE